MYILSIDTATNAGGVALSRNAEVIGLVLMKTPLRYSDHLISMVDFVLAGHRLQLKDVSLLSVAAGPGSFTGLRIGLATVKAFGQAGCIPAVGVSTLEALAYRFRHLQKRIVPFLDARRQQVYAAAYDTFDEEFSLAAPESVSAPADWLHAVEGEGMIFVGDGAQLYRTTIESLKPRSRVLATDNAILESLCQLGYVRHARGKSRPVDALEANYVRPSDAELTRELGR